MARPTIRSTEIEDKLVEIFHIDGTVNEACSQAGIWRTTYYEWLEKDEAFANKMAQAQDYAFIVARKTLFNAASNGSEKAAVEILKRRDKRYNDKIDQTSNVNLNAKVVTLPPLSDDAGDSTTTEPVTSD